MIEKGDVLYFARILPNLEEYDLLEVTVRMITDEWFSATESKTKRAYIFNNDRLNVVVFRNRSDALDVVNEAREKEKD